MIGFLSHSVRHLSVFAYHEFGFKIRASTKASDDHQQDVEVQGSYSGVGRAGDYCFVRAGDSDRSGLGNSAFQIAECPRLGSFICHAAVVSVDNGVCVDLCRGDSYLVVAQVRALVAESSTDHNSVAVISGHLVCAAESFRVDVQPACQRRLRKAERGYIHY